MARVTVEDCLQHVENRFALVLKAAERAHHLELGVVDAKVPEEKDKPTVIALREIAAGFDFADPKTSELDQFSVEVDPTAADSTTIPGTDSSTLFKDPED